MIGKIKKYKSLYKGIISNREGSDFIKKLKDRLIILGTIFFIIMSISGFNVVKGKTQKAVKNPVDIKIETYKGYESGKTFSPGEVVSFVPKVLNTSVDCYLRVKIEYVNSNTDFLDYITDFPESLEKHGEYYYLKNVFKANEVLNLFNTIKIPEDAELRVSGKNVRLEIIAEAIQADGFNPDYSLEDPWKGVIPEKNTGQIIYIDDDTEEHNKKKNPKTEDSIDIYIVTFVISAIGLIITIISYGREKKKDLNF